MALTSITLDTRASVSGRVLARNGAVTMDTSHVFGNTCPTTGDDAGQKAAQRDGRQRGGTGKQPGGIGGSDAALDGDVSESGGSDGGDAGTNLCCNGVFCGAVCINLSGTTPTAAHAGTRAHLPNTASAARARRAQTFAEASVCTSTPMTPTAGHAATRAQRMSIALAVVRAVRLRLRRLVCDLTADKANCGACGNGCAPDEHCAAGACLPCAMLCGGACVDTDSD